MECECMASMLAWTLDNCWSEVVYILSILSINPIASRNGYLTLNKTHTEKQNCARREKKSNGYWIKRAIVGRRSIHMAESDGINHMRINEQLLCALCHYYSNIVHWRKIESNRWHSIDQIGELRSIFDGLLDVRLPLQQLVYDDGCKWHRHRQWPIKCWCFRHRCVDEMTDRR